MISQLYIRHFLHKDPLLRNGLCNSHTSLWREYSSILLTGSIISSFKNEEINRGTIRLGDHPGHTPGSDRSGRTGVWPPLSSSRLWVCESYSWQTKLPRLYLHTSPIPCILTPLSPDTGPNCLLHPQHICYLSRLYGETFSSFPEQVPIWGVSVSRQCPRPWGRAVTKPDSETKLPQELLWGRSPF